MVTKGLYSKFHFLEYAFGTTYYVVDKQNGHMMGIFNDTLEDIDCDTQMKPFNLAQLSQMIATLEQRKTRFLMIPLFQITQMLQITTDYSAPVHQKNSNLLILQRSCSMMVTC